ncbi:class I SAM-dependent methyltransferase [Mycolicibacterium stellerae]|uniref:class I SAM-dependent methyltransferase n=1 Tax=Mycolicibacterium stellerae TaxID=2358193 RepID=UPI000F0B3F08|nr:class I SAM-dependent methyltransferase [Mycolicibacterium stellerae]
MNKAHEKCGGDEWRQVIREVILPWALRDTDLGDDVLEVGPGYGATTDVLSRAVPRLTSVEIDEELAAMLTDRYADVPSVEIVNGDATSLSYADDRFSGAACFTMLHHVPTIALQDQLFAEVARVLRPGAPLVASDSLGSEELKAHHEDDTYNPVDPASLPDRLAAAGFVDVNVRVNEFGWGVIARAAD